MTLYEIVLDYSFISIVIIAIIPLYRVYIEDIKKRLLNKTEKIIGGYMYIIGNYNNCNKYGDKYNDDIIKIIFSGFCKIFDVF